MKTYPPDAIRNVLLVGHGGTGKTMLAEAGRHSAEDLLPDVAVPALVEGLTFPAGFAEKRALVCQALGRIGSRDAAPFLAGALRDPTPAVTEWACWALEGAGDPATVAQIRRYEYRVPALSRSAPGGGDGLVLAHGAGADADAPLLVALANAFAAAGVGNGSGQWLARGERPACRRQQLA